MFRTILLASATLMLAHGAAQARDLKSIGITVGSLGNPFFVSVVNGATAEAKKINPNMKIISASSDYDLNKQFTQFDNFIAAGVDAILVNAADARAIAPAVKKAQAAGIAVIAVDVAAAGADATVQTDNTKAGAIACQYMADKIGHKGNVIIQNGPQVSSVIERVNGCKAALAKDSGITVLSSDQDAKGSRDGGLNVMQGYLTRYPDIKGLFAINDPQAIGSDLAAKQLHREGIVIVSVDGAPDVVPALKGNTMLQASASQDPGAMGRLSVDLARDILAGKKPAQQMTLLDPALVTRDNVGTYKGW